MIAGSFVKQSTEEFPVSIDFSDNLFGGSVSTCNVTAHDADTGADVSATVLTGSTTVASPFATHKVKSGTHGKSYFVQFRATMTGGAIIEDELLMTINDL